MKKFNCKRCGYCCTLIPKISILEMLRIWLKGFSNFSTKDGSGRRCIKIINGDCYFLKRDGKTTTCKIYKIRPKVCKDFPNGEKNNVGECNADKRSFKEKYLKNYYP